VTSVKSLAKRGLLRAVAASTRRHAVLLPKDAADDRALLDVAAPYRVDGPELVISIREQCRGTLTTALLVPHGANGWRCRWRSAPLVYGGPTSLRFAVGDGSISIADFPVGKAPMPLPSRRFRLDRLQLPSRYKSGQFRFPRAQRAIAPCAGPSLIR